MLKIINSTGLVAVVKACNDKVGWLAAALPTCTWVCLWKDRTGRNEGTAMSIATKWEKQTFLGEVSFQLFFPLNSFPSANFPIVCRVCSQTELFPCKYFTIFPLHVPHFLQKLKLHVSFLALASENLLGLHWMSSTLCFTSAAVVVTDGGVRRSLLSNQSPLCTEPHAATLACVGELALC